MTLDFKSLKALGEGLSLLGLTLWFIWRLRRGEAVYDATKADTARKDLRDGLEWLFLGALAIAGALRWIPTTLWVGLPCLALGIFSEFKALMRLHRGILGGFAATNAPWREPLAGENRAARRQQEREQTER